MSLAKQANLFNLCRFRSNLSHPIVARRHYHGGSSGSIHSAALASRNLVLGRHVREALLNGSPIVALESTVITHGLPEPQNLELALSLERRIVGSQQASSQRGLSAEVESNRLGEPASTSSDGGCQKDSTNEPISTTRRHSVGGEVLQSSTATPATIGIVKGQLVVGLSKEEIQYLATRQKSKPIKASRRDIPIAVGKGLSAGTTVSATMAIAHSVILAHNHKTSTGGADANQRQTLSPIKVFATGGTGGVHMGGEQSMDISADLYEMARSPMGIVSSGFKSFLDTQRTLEFLETIGCTVMSLSDGQNAGDEQPFPAFFSRSATNRQGEVIKSPCVAQNVKEAARILYECLEGPVANRRASLLAVPIPREFSYDNHNDLDGMMAKISGQIDKRTDLKGWQKTPLILEQLARATGGQTLRANIALLENNAQVGAQLAYEYALLVNRTGRI